MRPGSLPLVCPALVAVLMTGCAAAPPPLSPPTPESSAAAIERARADSARIPYTANDVRFMQMMVGHHAQALVMSELVEGRSTDAAIRTLAARIINSQRDEIAQMQRWLGDRLQPVPAPTADDAHVGHHASMPGMLSVAELDALRALQGPAFDRAFLRAMITHHEGAVAMVTTLFATDGAGQNPTVFRFASDVQVDQRTEIARMQRMLAARLFAEADA